MKTVYLRQIYMGTIGDTKNLEILFAEMAEQGWMIDKIGVMGLKYRSIEPSKKRFIVDFLPQITNFDYPENEDAQDYRRMCEESGWDFITASKQVHVFCADEGTAEPVPIHTDNKIQAQIHLRMCWKYELFNFIFTMVMFGAFVFMPALYSGMELFLSNIFTLLLLGWALFLVGYVWNLGFVLWWYFQTRKSVKYDLPLPVVNYRLAKIRRKVFAASMIAFIVCMVTGLVLETLGGMPVGLLLVAFVPLVGLGIGLWVRHQIDTKRRSRKANMAMTFVAVVLSQIMILSALLFGVLQNIPNRDISSSIGNRPALTLYSLGITQEVEHTSTHIRGSIAVPIHYNYWEMNQQGNVSTEVYRPISTLITRGLYNRFVRELEEGYARAAELRGLASEIITLSSDEAAFWGADRGIFAITLGMESTEPTLNNGNVFEMILQSGNTIMRLSVYGEHIEKERIAEAVRNLMKD